MRIINWLSGSKVDDTRFGGHLVTSEPIRVAPGARVWCNINMGAFYRKPWMPDKAISEYVDSVDGWLKDDAGDACVTRAGRTILDVSIVDGGEIMRILFKWARENEWIDGFWLELLAATVPLPGWGRSVDWRRYWEECMAVIQVRNRSCKWDISLNGYHAAYVPREFLDQSRGVTRLKIEGGLWRPEFPDLHDHHDFAGGAHITSPWPWIERMEMGRQRGVTATLEVFAQGEWGQAKRDQCIRITSSLAKLYDADYTGHVEEPGFWTRMDPWFPFYDRLLGLGEPTQPNVVRDAEVLSRSFEHGQLLVNVSGNDVRCVGETIPAMDVVIR